MLGHDSYTDGNIVFLLEFRRATGRHLAVPACYISPHNIFADASSFGKVIRAHSGDVRSREEIAGHVFVFTEFHVQKAEEVFNA